MDRQERTSVNFSETNSPLENSLLNSDGSALATEMENLLVLPKEQMSPFELLTYLSQNEICELYPNLWVALRIVCTLPLTVASAEQQEQLEIFHGTRKTVWTGSDKHEQQSWPSDLVQRCHK
ncbi:zinc finger MYM-type protein 1-like [Xyrichtys novacula]|uniref:Zinc finger MYM-type protein 1-like n=1 Tax=Xyrichtys novacula TaxID=13765 RepID=A0AAV1H049_XYRNO|nr:zinc finger MYM-type protein 1-like [Xyrichtys novacula]